ncbi:hypothetical protein ACFC1T_27765 [Kitasatospora sp. NPDC056076]|uniref:hypothetical protein n=1 Tax=Kitasatospora sp. NPDC056076 TaxID=3345703 RepID=UPI0035D9BBE1
MTTLADRVPLAVPVTHAGLTRARIVPAIPTGTPGLYVAWSSRHTSYAVIHASGRLVAYGWPCAKRATFAAEDYLLADSLDWTGSVESIRKVPYQVVMDVDAVITQHGGVFAHSLT